MQKQFSSTVMSISAVVAMLAISLLSGCGEFAYKRGATANDLQAARKNCSAQGDSPVIVEQCLADNGWTVKPLDKMDPLLATAGISDNRTGKQISKGNSKPSEESLSAEPAKPADPLDSFRISSWWKTGADGNALKSAINECVASLGEEYRPAPGSLNATRGLLVCMRSKGWYALSAQ